MTISEKKALKYLTEGKVFKLTKDHNYELYGVEGTTGIYEVRYDTDKMLYRCNCKNIRNSPCSHIKSVMGLIIMRDTSGKSDIKTL